MNGSGLAVLTFACFCRSVVCFELVSPPIFNRFIASKYPLVNHDVDYPQLWQTTAAEAGFEVRGVINLAGNLVSSYSEDVHAAIEARRWATVHIPIEAGFPPSSQQFVTLRAFVEEAMDEPGGVVVVHCTNGVHRTGAFCVRYAIENLEYDPEEALRQFETKRFPMARRPRCREYALLGSSRVDQMEQLADMIWASAKEEGTVNAELFASVAEAAIPALGMCRPSAMATLARAFAKADFEAAELFEALEAEALKRMGEFSPNCLCKLTSAFAKVGVWTPALFEALGAALTQVLPLLRKHELVMVALAFKEAGAVAPPDLLEAFPNWARRGVVVNPEFFGGLSSDARLALKSSSWPGNGGKGRPGRAPNRKRRR